MMNHSHTPSLWQGRPAAWLMAFVLLLAAGSLRAQKRDGYFGDSTLYALSMQMFDSIQTPAFFDMQRRGLERAVATGSKHFDYVFRSAPLSRCEVTGDKPSFPCAAWPTMPAATTTRSGC